MHMTKCNASCKYTHKQHSTLAPRMLEHTNPFQMLHDILIQSVLFSTAEIAWPHYIYVYLVLINVSQSCQIIMLVSMLPLYLDIFHSVFHLYFAIFQPRGRNRDRERNEKALEIIEKFHCLFRRFFIVFLYGLVGSV